MLRFLDRLIGAGHGIGRFGAWFGGALLFAGVAVVTAEVILRRLFTYSIGGADELSSYCLAIATSWGFGHAVLHRAHIRIDVPYAWLGVRARAWLDLLALLATLTFAGLLAGFAWISLDTSIQRGASANTPLQTPLWIPQSLWVAGLIFFLAVTGLLLLRTAAAFWRRDFATASALAGIRRVGEEVAEARRAAGLEAGSDGA